MFLYGLYIKILTKKTEHWHVLILISLQVENLVYYKRNIHSAVTFHYPTKDLCLAARH